jgi:hypothetical protein
VLTSLDLPIFADPSAAAFNQTVRSESVDMSEAINKRRPKEVVVVPSPEGGPIRGKSCDSVIVDDVACFGDVEIDDDDIPF